MQSDTVLLATLTAIAGFIALPALIAAYRRRVVREASEVATALADFARSARQQIGKGPSCASLDAALCSRAEHLRIPEFASLLLVQELPQSRPEMLADTAQRLALRLKRRVAFERKMLARTASGRRRGAIAAAIPPLVLLMLRTAGVGVPTVALAFLLFIEGCGCWLLWRVARVEI
jgi:Flp pilus assembly protein TadB